MSGDTVVFSTTYKVPSTVDASFAGTVAAVTIQSGYNQAITQNRSLTVSGAFNMASGNTATWNANGNNLTLGSYTQAAGVFQAPSGTLTLKGSYTYTAGTFTHNNGTVLFDSTLTAAVGITGTGVSFYNLSVNRTGGTGTSNNYSFSSGSTFTVVNDVTVANNTNYMYQLTGSGATLTINGDLLFPSTASTGILYTQGFAIDLDGDLTMSDANVTLAAAAQTITMDNAVVHNITQTTGTMSIPNFVVNNASGEMKLLTAMTTASSSSSITITNGTFNQNGFNLSHVGAVTLAAGTWTGSTGTTSIAGLTVSGGIFNPSTTSFTLTGNYSQSSGTFNGDLLSSMTWTNRRVTMTGGTFDAPTSSFTLAGITMSTGTGIFNSGSSLSLTSTFNYSVGTFNSPSSSMTIGALATISGGSFVAPPTLTCTGGLTVSSGSFTAPDSSGTFLVGSDFTYSGGTYSHNNGTIIFDSTLASASPIIIGGGVVFYNVIFDRTSGTATSYSWLINISDFTVANDLSFQNNTNYLYAVSGSRTVTVNGDLLFPSTSATGYVSTAAFNIDLDGDLTVTDANARLAYTTSQTITFDNAVTHNITYAAGTIYDPRFIVNNASGEMKLLSALTCSVGYITITNGVFNQNGQNLTLGGTATLTTGTWDGSTGSTTITGNLAINGTGTFNPSTTAFTLTGANLTQSNGQFNGNLLTSAIWTGTIILTGGIFNAPTSTLTTTGLTMTSGTGTFNSGDAYNTTGILNYTAGTFNEPSSTLTVGDSNWASGTDYLIIGSDKTIDLPATFTDASDVLIQSGGVLNGGNSTAYIGGNFHVYGTFNGGTSAIQIRIYLDLTGTFNADQGQIIFIADDTSGYNIISSTAVPVFYDLVFDKWNNVASTSRKINKSITVSHDLIIRNTQSSNVGYTLAGTTTSTITVYGDLLLPSSSTTGTVTTPASYITYNIGGDVDMANTNATLSTPIIFNNGSTHNISVTSGSLTSTSIWTTNNASEVINVNTLTPTSNAGTITLQDGTINNTSANIRYCNLTQTGGTFNAGADEIMIIGDLNHTSGTLNNDGGKVNFAPEESNIIIKSSGVHFNNVEFSKTYTGQSFANLQDSMYIDGNLEWSNEDGSSYYIMGDTSAQNVYVSGNLIAPSTVATGTVNLGYTTTHVLNIYLSGNLEINDANATLYANINFDGTNQTVSQLAGSIVSSSTWTVDDPDTALTQATDISGAHYLAISNGEYDCNGHNLTLNTTGTYTQSGGIFTGGSGIITHNGSFTLSGGTYNASPTTNIYGPYTQSAGVFEAPSILTIGNTFTISGGIFNHHNGTVVFNDTNAYTITAGGVTFNNVAFEKTTSTTRTLTLASGLTIANNLSFETKIASYGLTVQGASSVYPIINVAKSVSFPSNSYSGVIAVGSATAANNLSINIGQNLTIADANAQLYAGITMNDGQSHTINKSAGTVYNASTWSIDNPSTTVTLTASYTGDNDFNIINGTLDLAGYSLTNTGSGADVVVSGGSIDGSTGTMNLRTLNLSSGTVDCASTTSISTSTTVTGGSLNAGTSLSTGALTLSEGTINSGSSVTTTTFAYSGGTFVDNNTTLTSSGTFTVSAGIFNAPTVFNADGGMTLSGGTFEALTAGTLKIGNTFNNTGTVFNHNSGTVTFVSSNSAYNITTAGQSFYNLSFDKTTGASVFLTFQDSFIVENDLTMADNYSGYLYLNGISTPTITVNGDVSLPSTAAAGRIYCGYSSNNINLNIKGNFTNADGTAVFMYANTHFIDETVTSQISGATSWYGKFGTTTPGKTLQFQNGVTQTLSTATNLDIKGSTDAPIYLRSQSEGNQWTINSSGANAYVTNADIEDGNGYSSGYQITAYGSTNSGNNTYWNFNGGYYWVGTTSSWNTANNWASTSGGTGGIGVPPAGSYVYFDGGGTGDCTVDTTVNVGSVSLRNGFTGVLSTGANTITTTDDLSVAGGTLTMGTNNGLIVGGNVSLNGGTLNLSGYNITIVGNFTRSNGTLTHTGGTATFSKASDIQTLATGNQSFYNLTHSGAGTLQLSNTLNIANNLTNLAGIIDLKGKDLTVGGTVDNTATIKAIGSESNVSWSNDADSGTFEYYGSGSYTTYTKLSAGNAYYNLIISGVGYYPATGNLTIGGNLTLSNAASTFDIKDYNVSGGVSTVFNNNGILQLDGRQTITNFSNDTDSGSVVYRPTSTGATVKGWTYYDLLVYPVSNAYVISTAGAPIVNHQLWVKSGIFQPAHTIDVNGELKYSGGYFDLSAYDPNMTINGAITITVGAYWLAGDGTITIDGNTTYSNNYDNYYGTYIDSNSAQYNYVSLGNVTVGGATDTTLTCNSGLFVNDLVIGSGDTINMTSYRMIADDVTVGGTLTFGASQFVAFRGNYNNTNGTLNAGTSIITLNGASTQTITAGGTTSAKKFYRIRVNNTATNSLIFADSMAAYYLDNYSYRTAGKTMTFNAGSEYDIDIMRVRGAATYRKIIQSSTTDSAWNLNANNSALTYYTDVEDSDASGGVQAIGYTYSTDNGGNTNWLFTTPLPTTYVWDGGGDGVSWADPLNWDQDYTYPSAENHIVTINIGSATITTPTDSPLNLGILTLGNSFSGTLQLGNDLSVTDLGGQDGDQNVNNTATVIKLNGYNLSVDGQLVNYGTIQLTGDEQNVAINSMANSGIMEYIATSGTRNIQDIAYYTLKINGDGGTFLVPSDIEINDDLVVAAGTLDLDGSTITVAGDYTNSGGSVAGSGTLVFNETTTQTLTSGGADSGKIIPNINHSGTGTLVLSGNLGVSDSLLNGTGIIDIGSNNLSVATSYVNNGILRVSGIGQLVLPDNYAVGTTEYTATSGTVPLSGLTYDTLTINGTGGTFQTPLSITSNTAFNILAGTFTHDAGDTIHIKGNMAIDESATVNNSGTTDFNGTGVSVINNHGKSLHDLTLTGSGTYRPSSTLTANGDLTLTSGQMDLATNNPELQVAGNLTVNGGTVSPGSGTTLLNGDLTYADNVGGTNFGDIRIGASPDTTDLSTDMTCSSISIAAGDILNTNGYDIDCSGGISIASTGLLDATDDVETDTTQINLGGNWSNGGTFTASDSTVTFDGTGTQSIASGASDFYNLTNLSPSGITFTDGSGVTGTFTDTVSASTVTFNAGSTYDFANINIAGGSSEEIVLQSSIDDTQWFLNVTQSSPSADYVNVQDSDANGGNEIDASTGGINSGNNENWNFGGGDTTPPEVMITSHDNNETVSGTITFAGTASDDVLVSLVETKVDSESYTSASGTTNWSQSINTTGYSNGNHTFYARATDSSNNTDVAQITLNIQNTGGSLGFDTDPIDINIDILPTISLTCDATVTMNAITGYGQSDLSDDDNRATCTVATNNSTGYNLTWKSADTGSMVNSASDVIPEYIPASAGVAEVWSAASTVSAWGAHIGYGSTTRNDSFWGSGTNARPTYSTGYNWLNVSTSDFSIVTRSTETSALGDTEYLWFGAEVGPSAWQPTGTYTQTVSLTASTL